MIFVFTLTGTPELDPLRIPVVCANIREAEQRTLKLLEKYADRDLIMVSRGDDVVLRVERPERTDQRDAINLE
jgi:hypothetical protein